MIGVIIIFWLLNQFIVFIVLMNFMIAIISQSYEDIQSDKSQILYQQRAKFNFDSQLILDRVGKFFCIKRLQRTSKVDMLTVSGKIFSQEQENADDEWDGMATQVKKTVSKLLDQTFEPIDKCVSTICDKLNEVRQKQASQDNEFMKVTNVMH